MGDFVKNYFVMVMSLFVEKNIQEEQNKDQFLEFLCNLKQESTQLLKNNSDLKSHYVQFYHHLLIAYLLYVSNKNQQQLEKSYMNAIEAAQELRLKPCDKDPATCFAFHFVARTGIAADNFKECDRAKYI